MGLLPEFGVWNLRLLKFVIFLQDCHNSDWYNSQRSAGRPQEFSNRDILEPAWVRVLTSPNPNTWFVTGGKGILAAHAMGALRAAPRPAFEEDGSAVSFEEAPRSGLKDISLDVRGCRAVREASTIPVQHFAM